MINRKQILAIAATGEWFNTLDNLADFKRNNPTSFTVKVGDTVTILNKRLMSYQTTGKIIGFDQTSTGRFLLMVKWEADAAPLRVRIEAVMPCPPNKFWMVIPFNEQARNQNTYYDGSARRNGLSPAVHRFPTRAQAVAHIASERRASRYHEYVILESVTYQNGDVVVPM